MSFNHNKITLKQLAQELGLSTSTISRAMSDDYQISTKTKEMILKYAEKRQYKVNLYAKSLREGKTRTIGVVVCYLGKAFMNQVINSMYNYWHDQGYQLIVLQSKGNNLTEQACIQRLLEVGVDGLLISPSFDGANIKYLNQVIEERIPTVVFDRINEQLNTTQIASDNFLGGKMAAGHISSKGMKKVLLIGVQKAWLSKERIRGFLSCIPDDIDYTTQSILLDVELSLLEQLEAIFDQKLSLTDFDAIYTTTDTLTLTVLRFLKRLDIYLPVIGFCNNDFSDILYGQPVTIIQPSKDLGELASQKLLSAIQNKEKPNKEIIYLPTHLKDNSYD
jgi:LacI family transcriptional regulator